MIKVLVTGSRDWDDEVMVYQELILVSAWSCARSG
jgi:hypothetical protein